MEGVLMNWLGYCSLFIFALALVHTFAAPKIHDWIAEWRLSRRAKTFLGLLAEAELAFLIWSVVLLVIVSLGRSPMETWGYLKTLSITEPLFILTIMLISATRPVRQLAEFVVLAPTRRMTNTRQRSIAEYGLILGLTPLLGSLITEPAAITVAALLLRDRFFSKASTRMKYLTLATLFVNVSIGGVLTPFAAPPVLMVAGKWGWDLSFMAGQFGWKAVVAVVINSLVATWLLKRELMKNAVGARKRRHVWTFKKVVFVVSHAAILAAVVVAAHNPVMLLGLLLTIVVVETLRGEDKLQFKPALLVAGFLSGLMIIGGFQTWWIKPLMNEMSNMSLYISMTLLTAITDNAALTYLGAQTRDVAGEFGYWLVAGAITGGGLTIIANAPNPIGYSLLQEHFPQGLSPVRLFRSALTPTAVAFISFWILR